jgi:hypothetical protein
MANKLAWMFPARAACSFVRLFFNAMHYGFSPRKPVCSVSRCGRIDTRLAAHLSHLPKRQNRRNPH